MNLSQSLQIIEEHKEIKICKVPAPSGLYCIYKGNNLIMGGFTSAKFVPCNNYAYNKEYKFIVCKTSFYDEDREEFVGLWHLFDIEGNKLLGTTKCTRISLPNISSRNFDDKVYGRPCGSIYGENLFITEYKNCYSLVLSDGRIIYNCDEAFNALQFGENVIIHHIANKYDKNKKDVYGVIRLDGNIIIPFVYSSIKPVFDKTNNNINYSLPWSYQIDRHKKCPKESVFLLELDNGKSMFIDNNGFPIIKNGKDYFIFQHKKKWIGDFKNSIAPVYDKYEGLVTINNEPVIILDNKNQIVLDSQYKVAIRLAPNVAKVLRDKEYLYDLEKKAELCSGYDDIHKVTDNIYIADNSTLIVLDKDCNVIVEQTYPSCKPLTYKNEHFFLIGSSEYNYDCKYGIIDEKGQTILETLFKKICINEEGFFECLQEEFEKSSIMPKGEKTVYFSKEAIEFFKIEDGYLPLPLGFEDIKYLNCSLFKYSDNDKYGIINIKGESIVEPKYDFISDFKNGFALVYIKKENCYTEYWGVINTRGNEIIPPLAKHISSIDVLNNGWFACTDEEFKTSVYDTSGNVLWDSPMGKVNSMDGTKHFFSVGLLDHMGVVDIYGRVIIPLEYHEVCFFDTMLFLVKKQIWNYNFSDRSGYIEDNSYGTEICGLQDVHNDTIIKLEYQKIEKVPKLTNIYIAKNDAIEQYQLLPENNGCETQLNYVLVNSSGDIIYSARKIKYIGNNFFVVRQDGKEGVIDLAGKVIVPIKFEYVGNFYNRFFWVSNEHSLTGSFSFEYGENVEGEHIRKVNLKGELSANDNGNTIWVPSEYDWATDFVEQLSIVRKDNLLGVIDSSCNKIVDTIFDSILILENHTILVSKLKEDESIRKGIFGFDGNEIIPVEYNHIKYISQNRYKIGRENYFLIVNQKGEELTEEFLTIQDFKSIYDGKQERLCAIVYKNKELKDNGKWYYKDGGVVDIDGNEILPYTYDKVTLYPPHYALCVRKGIRSIADLSNGKQIRYPNLKIKHTWGIDVLGRCVFSEDCTYDSNEGEWKDGTRGVFDINGVIIPSGKYSQIILVDSGLMIVGVNNRDSDDDNKDDEYSLNLLWGIVDQAGKEIISPKYSQITQIRGDYLLVYKGKNSSHCNRKYEGIWAIMNMSEELIKEFEFDFEAQSYLQDLDKGEGVETCPNNTSTYYYYEVPKVLLSEAIKRKENRSSVYYDDNQFDDEEDLGRSKYGGYNGWDDNTIDEAFDGNPELTWNID